MPDPALRLTSQITSKVISLIQNFCSQAKALNSSARRGLEAARAAAAAGGEGPDDDRAHALRFDQLGRYEKNFDHNLKVYIETVTYYGGNDSAPSCLLLVSALTLDGAVR